MPKSRIEGRGPSWGLVLAYSLTGSYLAKFVPQPDVTRIDVIAEMPGGEQTMASRPEAEIAPAIAALAAARVEAVQFMTSPFLNSTRATFIAAMTKMKLPAMYEWPETVEEGGLVSYAPRISLCYRHVAVLVSKVLRGAKPADLPIEPSIRWCDASYRHGRLVFPFGSIHPSALVGKRSLQP